MNQLKPAKQKLLLTQILFWYCCYFRFQESKVLMWGGFFFMVVGRALYIPWGNQPPIIAEEMTGLSQGCYWRYCSTEWTNCMLNYFNFSPSFLQCVIHQETKCYYCINKNYYQIMDFMHYFTLVYLVSSNTILII